MEDAIKINQLWFQVQQLNTEAQKSILKKLQNLLKKSKVERSEKEEEHYLADLDGVGAEMWQSIDTDEYVRELREEWD